MLPVNQQEGTSMDIQGFGLAFDIERTTATRSGYKPARYDMGGIQELFGELRLAGFAAMLRMNIVTKITIVGGDEGRYKNDSPINRAVAIREMLIHDCGIDPARVDAIPSKSNTLGNVGIIRDRTRSPNDIVVTSHYHIPRATMDIAAEGLSLKMIAAEAFMVLEDPTTKDLIIESLGGNALAMRCAEEIQGIAHKLNGSYQSRTDAVPMTFASTAKV
jgi:hypothetical protein